MNAAIRMIVRQRHTCRIVQKLPQQKHLARKGVDAPSLGPGLQGPCRTLVGTRRPAQPQIDPARREQFQHPELLGHFQGAVMGQHHPAGPHPNGRGFGCNLGDQNLWAGPGKRLAVVVLGQPVARVAQSLAGLGKLNGFRNRFGGLTTLGDGGLIQYR